jgi:peptide chain release factor 2
VSELRDKISEQKRALSELRTALKLDALRDELGKLEKQMERPDFWSNQETAQKTVQRLKGIKQVVDPFIAVEKRLKDVDELAELAEAEKDQATIDGCLQEVASIGAELEKLKLRALLSGEYDSSSAYINIQAGTGGLDACDWSRMVLRMLTRYAEMKGFKVTPVELTPEPSAGIKNGTILIEGAGAYGWMKSEQGTHRLVRISPFDAQSRRQTAFAAVEVLPEVDDEGEVDIKESDCTWEFFATGGPGGQHVNKTQSGARVRHKPSGIVVQCTEERSQHANRRRALKILASKLANLAAEARAKQQHEGYQAKSSMGFGASDRVRSYTLQPFTLVKDHRTGVQTSDTDGVLDGNLEEFVEAYLKWRASGGKPVGTAAEDEG